MISRKKVYTIHSQKGGVGKTSIAVAIAGLSCLLHGQKTLIIDCDLTGTSIIDLFYDFDENNKEKKDFRYLNNLLLATPSVFNSYGDNNKADIKREYFCTIGVSIPNLYYIPSSPILEDIREIAGLISQENRLHYFQSRMEDILDLFINGGTKIIIIDCPPGLFGLSSAMLRILDSDKYDKKCLFITSSDPTDYRSLIPSYSSYYSNTENNSQKDKHKFIFNKCTIGEDRDPVFLLNKILKNLKRKGAFLDERVISPEVLNGVEESLKKHGSNVLPFVEGFDMLKIISSIQVLEENKNKGVIPSGPMEKWCNGIKELLDL